MTNILALETSSSICSVSLKTNNLETSVFKSKSENNHGVIIFDFIEAALKEARISKSELDFIAFSSGPGSFTGLRIGCSVAQGLGYGLNIPILPISSLQILAQQMINQKNLKNISVILDAHMEELYIGQYKNIDNIAWPIKKDLLLKKSELIEYLAMNKGNLNFIGAGCNFLPDEYKSKSITDIVPLANTLFKISEEMILNNEYSQPEDVILNYLSGEEHWSKS